MARMLGTSSAQHEVTDYHCCNRHTPGAAVRGKQAERRREDREWRREADTVLADRGPCGCHCHKRLDESDCCPICTNGYADLCAPPD